MYSHAPDKQIHFLGIATYSDKNATFVKWKWRAAHILRVFVDFYLESGRENKIAVCMFVCCLCCLFVSSMGSLTSWLWSKSWLVVLFKSSVLHASDCSVTWEHSRIFFFLMVIWGETIQPVYWISDSSRLTKINCCSSHSSDIVHSHSHPHTVESRL